MLSEVRNALAAAVEAGVPGIRVRAYPPESIDVPTSGLFAYVRGEASQYLTSWATFSERGRAFVNLELVLAVPASLGAERAHDLIDSAIDPDSTGQNVFAAILADRTLGLTDFQAQATPHQGDIGAPTLESYPTGDSESPTLLRYELPIPVQVIVQRS